MIKARDYQVCAVESIYHYFQKNTGNPIVAMPTGTGKSVVIAMFLESVFRSYPAQKVMILTHVKELIEQNYQKLLTLWPSAPAGIYSAGLNKRDTHKPITFAGIASVVKKASEFGHVNLVIIDEAHLVSPKSGTMYQSFIQELKTVNPFLKVIGFTATPWRLGHGKLTDDYTTKQGAVMSSIFDDFAFDITGMDEFNKLISDNYLSPLVPKSTGLKLDVDGVSILNGEFNEKELQLAVDRMEITSAAIREAIELAHDRRYWLVFATGIDHTDHTVELLNEHGISAVAVHSRLTSEERKAAIDGFKSGKYRAAVNNNVLTTGFDFPEIDAILCLRPTTSTVLWVQMLGRGTRPAEGKKNCLVLDFANNTQRLGPINDPVIPKKKGHGKEGTAPVKECPCCMTWVHASLRVCNGISAQGELCNYTFPIANKLHETSSTNQLIRGELPVTEIFTVDLISVSAHNKVGKPPSMRVSYYCGVRRFDEYVCIEHPTNAGGAKARHWWRGRSYGAEIPGTTHQAIEQFSQLRTPTHLRVWVNKQYPEIIGVCFDGTAFGTQEEQDAREPCAVEVHRPVTTHALVKSVPENPDDIPF